MHIHQVNQAPASTAVHTSPEQKVLHIVSRYLGCSPEVLTILRLGGYTNSNFKILLGDKSYFVKLGNPFGAILGVSFPNEVLCRALLKEWDLILPVLFYDSEEVLMVTEFIPSKEWDFSDSQIKERYVDALRYLHARPVRFPLEFCPFQAIQTYLAEIKRLGVLLPQDEFDRLLPKLEDLKQKLPIVEKVPCHLDLQIANVLATEDKIYFVDWECAGMADPFFDLASASASEELSDPDMYALLSLYLGQLPTQEEREHLYALRILADMRMCLICYLQTKLKFSEAASYRTFAENFLRQCSKRLLYPNI